MQPIRKVLPAEDRVPPGTYKGASGQPDRTFRVKDWLDRSWRNKPCELLVPTPPSLPGTAKLPPKAGSATCRVRQSEGAFASRGAGPRRADAGLGCTLSAVQIKETLLDEMEHGFWSACSQRRPVRPELRLRALGSHAWPERLRLQQLLPSVVPAVLWLRQRL